jgi:phospholipid/cholesterol/gamma-HCH transport system substrate-binding protein
MSQPFKFRYVNEITGIFVLLALVALIAGTYFAGKAQGLFEPKFRLFAFFTTEEGTFGLKKGSEIKIRNVPVGIVENIIPTESGSIKATFLIKKSYQRFVRSTSKAIVKQVYVVAGDSFVEITVGNSNDPILEDNSEIVCVKSTQILDQATKMLENVQQALLPALEKMQAALDELPPLMKQTKTTLNEAEKILHNETPALMLQAQDTLRSLQILIEGMQRHWLLRKYIEPEEKSSFVNPDSSSYPSVFKSEKDNTGKKE